MSHCWIFPLFVRYFFRSSVEAVLNMSRMLNREWPGRGACDNNIKPYSPCFKRTMHSHPYDLLPDTSIIFLVPPFCVLDGGFYLESYAARQKLVGMIFSTFCFRPCHGLCQGISDITFHLGYDWCIIFKFINVCRNVVFRCFVSPEYPWVFLRTIL